MAIIIKELTLCRKSYIIFATGGIAVGNSSYTDLVYNRILSLSPESAFIATDFVDIADYKAISKSLERLEDEKKIRRVIRGVYDCPKYSELLGEYEAPSPHHIAMAIARNNNWTIAPSGNTALNQLGLSTQVAAYWLYISDGPYKTYDINNVKIEFRHRNNKEISGMSYKTAMVIQAIKTLKQQYVGEDTIKHLKQSLTDEEKAKLLNEAKQTTTWVYAIIRKICKSGE